MFPDTLPANFDFNTAPDTLPADFNFGIETPAADEKKKPGFFQSVIQSISKPILKTGSALSQVEGGLILKGASLVSSAQSLLGYTDASYKTDKFAGNLAENMKKGATEGTDYGYFGKVKPIGSAFANDKYSTTEKVVRSALDTAGTVGEVASWAIGIPEAKATGFFAKAFETFKGIQPMAAAFGASAGTQALGEGKTAKDAAIEGFTTYAGTVVGNQLIHGVAQGAGSLARLGMKTAVGQALADKAVQFADHIYQMFPEKFQDLYKKGSDYLAKNYGKSIEAKNAIAEKDFQDWHSTTINDYVSAVQKEVDAHSIYNQVQTEATEGKSALQNSVREKYGAVIDSGAQIANGPVVSVLDSIDKDIERATLPGNVPPAGKMTAAEYAKMGATEASNPYEIAKGYADKVRQVMSMGDKTDIQVLYSLSQHAPSVPAGSPEESLITQLRNSIYNAIEKDLPSGFKKQWLEAKKLSEFVSNKIDTDTTKILSYDARTPETFAEKFFQSKTKPGDLENTFDLLSPKNKETMRQFLINQMFEMGKVANDKGHAATVIGDILDKYKGTSILSLEDVATLSDFQSLLKKDLTGFMDGMQHVIEPEKFAEGIAYQQNLAFTKKYADMVKAGNYSQIATEVSKIKSVEEMKAVVNLLGPEEKDLLASHVMANKIINNVSKFNIGADGKINLEGFLKEIESIGGENSKEIYGVLFNNKQQTEINNILELLRQQKDITQVSKINALSIIHGAAAILHLSLGHVPGAFYHGASASRAVTAKATEKVSSLTEKEMFDMLLGDKGKLNTFVRKGLDFVSKNLKKASPYVSGAGGIALPDYLKTVGIMKGSSLTPEEIDAATMQFNQNQ